MHATRVMAVARVLGPLLVGALPYALRREPVALSSVVGARAMGEARFARAWASWAETTHESRYFLGPWLMGHLSDAGLAAATAAFVDAMQSGAKKRTRLVWQGVAAALLVGLELAQAPLGFGTFDPVDVLVLATTALVTVALCERARANADARALV